MGLMRSVRTGPNLDRVPRKTQIVDDLATDEVLLDDALRILRRHGSIPRAFGIHDGDRPAGADAQALAPGPIARTIRARDIQFFHPALHVLPRCIANFGIDAVRSDTDEHVPLQLAHSEGRGGQFRRVVLLSHRSGSYGTRLARRTARRQTMADKTNRTGDQDENVKGAGSEEIRGVGDDDDLDEFDDSDDLDEEEDEESTTF